MSLCETFIALSVVYLLTLVSFHLQSLMFLTSLSYYNPTEHFGVGCVFTQSRTTTGWRFNRSFISVEPSGEWI